MLTILYEHKCELCLLKCTGTDKTPPVGWIELSKSVKEFEDRFVHVCKTCAEQVSVGFHAGLKR